MAVQPCLEWISIRKKKKKKGIKKNRKKTSHWIHSFIKQDTKYKKGIDKYKRQKITKCSVKVGLSVTFLIGNSQLSIGFNQKPTIIPTTAVKFFSIWYNYSTFSKFSKGNERQF